MTHSQAKSAVRYVTVSDEHTGQRVDNFLLRELKGAPKSLIYKLLRKGEVRVNKGRAKPDRRLEAGDVIRLPPISLPEPGKEATAGAALLSRLEGSILYEDKGLIVMNKPAGLAVHGGSGINLGLIEALRQSRPNEKSLELVHRLDRETSGCLMIAKKRAVLRFLQDALRERKVQKTYIALVKGKWPSASKRVEARLEKFTLANGERRVKIGTAKSKLAKDARTDFKILDSFNQGLSSCSLVEAKPYTGRTHQIRVHALSIGCPLVGDDKYTDDEFNQAMKKKGFKRLFLHAAQLSFPHLDSEENIKTCTVKAELPDDLKSPLNRLGNPPQSPFEKGGGKKCY